jgi:hypothetical protein
MATSGFQRAWVLIHSIIPRALRQRTTHNIDMALEPEEGGKLAHGRLQSTLPVRSKTRRQTITPDGTPGFLCLRNPGRRHTEIFLLRRVHTDGHGDPGTRMASRAKIPLFAERRTLTIEEFKYALESWQQTRAFA